MGSPQYEAQSLHSYFLLPTPGYEEDMEKVSSIFTVPSFPLPAATPIAFSLGPHLCTHLQFSGVWPYPFLLQRCESGKRGGIRGQRVSTHFLTLLPHLSREDTPTPKSSNSEDELPEDYPVVKNMLHRLTGKEGRREGTE